jgi:tetratricopeptide (TPR) repeat protein
MQQIRMEAVKFGEKKTIYSRPQHQGQYKSIIASLYDIMQCDARVLRDKLPDESREDLDTSQSDEAEDMNYDDQLLDTKADIDVCDDLSVGSKSITSVVSGQDEAKNFMASLRDMLSSSAQDEGSSVENDRQQHNGEAEDKLYEELLSPIPSVRVYSSSSNSSSKAKPRSSRRTTNMALLYAATLKGKYHKATADKLIKLGEAHFQVKEYERSLECFDRAHAIYVAKIGEDAIESIETKVKVGGAFVALKRPDDAMLSFTLARHMTSAVLSGAKADLQVAFLTQEIGSIQREKGLHADALKLMKQALRLYKKHHTELHPTVAKAASEIGRIHHLTGHTSKAITVYTQVLKVQVGIWGKMHSDVADTLLQLAILYNETGDVSRSMKIAKKSFSIYSATTGEHHLSVALVLCHFGNLYTKTGQHSKAFKAYGKALRIRRELLGRNHPLIADTIMEISGLFRQVGEPQQAILCMTEAVDIYKKAVGKDHTKVSDVLNVMGMTYYDTGDCDKAIRMYSQALNVRISAVGDRHPSVANALNNIGTVHSRNKDFGKALASYNSALKIYDLLPNPDHLKYCVTLVNIGTVLRGVGDFPKAEQVFKRALDICFHEAMLDESHPVVQKAQRSLNAMNASPYRTSSKW